MCEAVAYEESAIYRNIRMYFKRNYLFPIVALLLCTYVVSGQDFNSSSYSVVSPVIFPGGYGTSTNFSLTGVISQTAIGTSTSATKNLFGGFLYFPFVSTPIVSAGAGDTFVNLLWTNSNASVGWAVSGYIVGKSTVSGGPYTYINVNNTLSYSSTSLTNGTTYYYVVRVVDALGNPIATSTQVSSTPGGVPTYPTPAYPTPAAGGGGGGFSFGGNAIINFSGRAFPKSTVTILKDAQVVSSVVADAAAMFQVTVGNLTAGNYIFSVYGEDNSGFRSNPLTFPVSVTSGGTTNIGGIFITPTIAVDRTQVKKGENIAIFGQSANKSSVTIQVNSDEPFFAQTKADNVGAYLYNFDTTVLAIGDHSTKSKSAIDGEISSYSQAVAFKVGNTNVFAPTPTKTCNKRGDVNNDCKVNLTDYSIVAYWYKRANPPAKVDFNSDGQVTLIDFSILAFNWTG